jgi:hypothetical protein
LIDRRRLKEEYTMSRIFHQRVNHSSLTYSARLLIVISPLLLCTCSPTAPDSTDDFPEDALIVQNEGQICFYEIANYSNNIRGNFRPKGCFSSSCTRTLAQSIRIKVKAEEFRIEFSTMFVLAGPAEPISCTRDCNGARTINFDIADIDSGAYTVWLGDSTLGSLIVPPDSITGDTVCFGAW